MPGTATVEVTAEDAFSSKEYEIHFTLANPTPTAHGVTVLDDGDGTGSADPASAAGATITLTATPNRGHHFTRWQVVSPDGLSITNNTFTMPDEAVTVKAIFRANSSDGENSSNNSGGGSSGSCTTVTTQPEKQPDRPVTAAVSIMAAADSDGTSSAAVPDQAATDAIAKAQADAKAQGKTLGGISVALNITASEGTSALSATLSQTALKALVDANVASLQINGLPVSMSFDRTALRAVQSQSSGNATVTAAARQDLSDDAEAMIGTRPVHNITVGYTANGGASAVTNLGGGTTTISIPYAPAPGESAGYLYGMYVDGNGSATRIDGSAYDANSGCLIFNTGHLSIYGVGYTVPSAGFIDLADHWAKEFIDYAVGRGLFGGRADGKFLPDAAITRGDLATVLGRLSGADVSGYKTASFPDVKAGSYYLPYIEWARQRGILESVGSGRFAPERAVTREELAAILQSYAEATGDSLPVTRAAVTFADNGGIGGACKDAVKAMQQAGVLLGKNNNRYDPKSSATRAEFAAMLTRYVRLTIDPATAQGWAKNDSGQRMYFKDGKALTGWQTVGGKVYCFDSSGGAFAGGWKQNAKGEWFFLSSDGSAVTGWRDIGANGNTKRCYFDAYGVVAAGKWVEIDGKWHYFYADGSLAVNTTIDGYEVDKNGTRKTK